MSSDRPRFITPTGRIDTYLHGWTKSALITNGKIYVVVRWEGSLPIVIADDGMETVLHRATWQPATDNSDLIARLARAEAEVAAVRAALGK
jgi:hypothetical protein